MTQNDPQGNEKSTQDLTAEEVAHQLNCSSRTVRMWADSGQLPPTLFYKLPGGRQYRFKPEIIGWLRDGKAA